MRSVRCTSEASRRRACRGRSPTCCTTTSCRPGCAPRRPRCSPISWSATRWSSASTPSTRGSGRSTATGWTTSRAPSGRRRSTSSAAAAMARSPSRSTSSSAAATPRWRSTSRSSGSSVTPRAQRCSAVAATLKTLRELTYQTNPFRFIIYSEWAGWHAVPGRDPRSGARRPGARSGALTTVPLGSRRRRGHFWRARPAGPGSPARADTAVSSADICAL
jgi:hypothetical protein